MGYLVIKRQLLLLDWEFIPSGSIGFTLSLNFQALVSAVNLSQQTTKLK